MRHDCVLTCPHTTRPTTCPLLTACPTQEILDKYPPWLEKHAAPGAASSLPPAELERYRAQHAAISALVAAYESEPGNTAKIMELLQQVRS